MVKKYYEKIGVMVSVLIVALFSLSYSAKVAAATEVNKTEVLHKINALGIPFIENKGQVKDETVKYYAKTLGGTVFITEDGKIVYSLLKSEGDNKIRNEVFKESFPGSSVSQIIGEKNGITKISYFKGKDTSDWKTNIPTYNLVNLGEIYKGIELKLKAYNNNNVEKLFYIKPSADVADIKVNIEGAKDLAVNENGELVLDTDSGTVKFTKPVAYQEENGERKYVEVAYEIKENGYGFKVGNYNKTENLIIDPLLASTFLGGSSDDGGEEPGIAIDSSGNVYLVGATNSTNFPTTPGTYDTTFNGGEDVLVVKLDSELSAEEEPPQPSDNGGGGGGGGGGCFIATACFGTPMACEVKVLSRFRDDCLLTNPVGKGFVNAYYKISPPIADYIREHPLLKSVTRKMLRPLIWLAEKHEN